MNVSSLNTFLLWCCAEKMKTQFLHESRKGLKKAVSFTPFTKKLYHVLTQALNGKIWMFGQGYNEQTFNLPNAAAYFDLGEFVKFICNCKLTSTTRGRFWFVLAL
jgi:hypothetical protein